MISLIITMSVLFGSIFGNVTTFAASPANECPKQSFFSIPTWYKYLPVTKDSVTGQCEVDFSITDAKDNPDKGTVKGGFNGIGIILVGLAIVDILVRIAGMLAFGYIIYSGFKYMTSQGSPDGTKAAFSMIINASIGLLVAILAAAIISFLGSSLG